MAKTNLPEWQTEYLLLEMWTEAQFLWLLCGKDPAAAPHPLPRAERPVWDDADVKRVAMHVDAAIRSGTLKVVSDSYWAAVSYRVRSDVAILWATKNPGRFPQFPFTSADLLNMGLASAGSLTTGVQAVNSEPTPRPDTTDLTSKRQSDHLLHVFPHTVAPPGATDERLAGDKKPLAFSRRNFIEPRLTSKGWSTVDWALNANVNFNTANNYLRGKTKPRRDTLKKLADALGVAATEMPA
jgi:hypothetical protein